MINELIEQIGGRERLEFIAGNAISRERSMMARALMAVLDAKPAGVTVSPTLAAMDEVSQVGVDVYTTPPAASNVKLPTTRLWAGAIECYSKDDVISVLRSAGIEMSDD